MITWIDVIGVGMLCFIVPVSIAAGMWVAAWIVDRIDG